MEAEKQQGTYLLRISLWSSPFGHLPSPVLLVGSAPFHLPHPVGIFLSLYFDYWLTTWLSFNTAGHQMKAALAALAGQGYLFLGYQPFL